MNPAIGAMGITRIVIAHRRETIAAADRVLIMGDGKLPPTELSADHPKQACLERHRIKL